jgi:hypothetical protein
MKPTSSIAVTFFALAVALALVPADAAVPPFATYFSGTWTCTSTGGSTIVKVYGADAGADAMILHNVYDSPTGYINEITESYASNAHDSTVIAELSPELAYMATSPGFVNDQLVFDGTATSPSGSRFQRMTYTRTDNDHFTRVFEYGPSPTAKSPLTTFSTESCTRSAKAPVPSPARTTPPGT